MDGVAFAWDLLSSVRVFVRMYVYVPMYTYIGVWANESIILNDVLKTKSH